MYKPRKRFQAALSICLSLFMIFSFPNTAAWADESSSSTGGPAVTADNDGSDTTSQGGSTDNDGSGTTSQGGSTGNDGSGTTSQGGSTDNSGGDTTQQDGSTDNSGGDTTQQGGSTDNSGGDTTQQGETTDNSGGDTTQQDGNTDNSGGDTAQQGGTTDNSGSTTGSTPGTPSTEQDQDSSDNQTQGQDSNSTSGSTGGVTAPLLSGTLIPPDPIKVAGNAVDGTVTMATGNTEVSSDDSSWEIVLSTGTLNSSSGDDISPCLTVSGLPLDLTWAAVNGGSNNIIISVFGTTSAPISSQTEIAIKISGNAVSESGAADSDVVAAYINPASEPLQVLPMLSLKSPPSLQVAGTPTDMLVVMDTDGRNVYVLDSSWTIRLTSGTPKDSISSSDIAISPALPGSLSCSVAKSGPTDIIITLSGTADTLIYSEKTFTVTVMGNAVGESGYSDSNPIGTMLVWPYYNFNVVSGAAIITGYHGLETGSLIIPGTLTDATGTYPVAKTTVSAFGDSLFSSVTIPASMSYLDTFTFYNCTNLTSVVFSAPSSLTTISDVAFCNCTLLSSIDIPGSVTSILRGAFDNCQSLTTIDIPGSVTTLGDSVFERCPGLTSAYFLGAKPASFGSSIFESTTTLYYHVKYAASWAGTAYNATPFCILTLMDGGTVLSSGRAALDKTSYTLSPPDDPTGGSGAFLGWYRDPGGTIPFNFSTDAVSDDLTLYAKWGTGGVCSITSGSTTTTYDTLDAALAAVGNGESKTIKVLQNIDYSSGISISGKSITFDLNGHTLNLNNSSGTGLEVGSGGSVATTGSGQFNATGTDYGVYIHDGGLATVTSATSTGATGTGAKAASGGQITITGNASGASGVFATGIGSSIIVNGGVSGTDENGSGAWAAGGASINISGDVQGGVYGAHAINAGSVIQIGGSVSASNLSGAGAYADNGGSITVGGNAVGTGGSGIGACALAGSSITVTGDVQGVYNGVIAQTGSNVFVGGDVISGGNGVIARGGGEVTIDGIITVSSGSAMDIGTGTYNVITPTTKDGYITYSDGISTVWVKDNAVVESTTFVLSNEEGGLIDQLIADGYGNDSLYDTLVNLQATSGGVITDEFLETLAKCPAGSEIFKTKLSDYTGFNNPVCINSDGTVRVNDIHGRDYYGKTGYATYPEDLTGPGRELFTYASDSTYYIDAGSSSIVNGMRTYYKAFAIAWSPAAVEATTFVLTNEEGGLIDQLIAEGYRNSNLYEALVSLQDSSGGVITDEFMETLAACPAGSDVFTAKLYNYTGLNNPVGVNTDGTLIIVRIFGRDYHGKTGYATYPESPSAARLFTYATSPEYFIDSSSSDDGHGGNYKAFGIAWAPRTAPSAPAAPAITPNGGTFTNSVGVTITGSGGTIYYTNDGSDPRVSGSRIQYVGQFTLTSSAPVKAAIKSETAWSDVTSQTFTITTGGGGGAGGGDGGGDSPESINTTPEQVEAPNEPGEKNPAAEPTDLTGHWAHDCIMALIANGIIKGYPDGTIRPEWEITRAEAAVLLVNILGLQGYPLTSTASPYSDELPEWAGRAILILTEKGIMTGYPDGTFGANRYITRAEFCTALMQCFPGLKCAGEAAVFADQDNIPAWALPFIQAAVFNTIVTGYPDNTFQPQGWIKRGEAFAIICILKGYHREHTSQ